MIFDIVFDSIVFPLPLEPMSNIDVNGCILLLMPSFVFTISIMISSMADSCPIIFSLMFIVSSLRYAISSVRLSFTLMPKNSSVVFLISSTFTIFVFISCCFFWAPAMSIKSIALSGNFLLVKYCDDKLITFSMASFS